MSCWPAEWPLKVFSLQKRERLFESPFSFNQRGRLVVPPNQDVWPSDAHRKASRTAPSMP